MRVSLLNTVGLLLLLATTACDALSYHPYDVDISSSYRNINSKNVSLIESKCRQKDTLRFVATGDTQGWYDDTRDFVADVNLRADSIDFVIHVGDLSDYGAEREFQWQHDILGQLRVPYVCDIGNHDCLGNGRDVFHVMYGVENYAFIAGRVKFLMLNTNSLEYNYSEAVPDLNFIESEQRARIDEFDHTIVTMHARPYSDVFDDNVAKPFQFYIRRMPGLMFCLNGHNHTPEVNDIFDDGILYYQTANIARRIYYLFTVTPNGYSYETIDF